MFSWSLGFINRFKLTPLTRLQITESVSSYGLPVEFGHTYSKPQEHAFDLVVHAFEDRQAAAGIGDDFYDGRL